MSQYLVLLRHTMDDIPVRLCDTLAEAAAVARATDWMPTDSSAALFPQCSTPVGIDIVEFDDCGAPISLRHCRTWEEEGEEP